MDDLRENHNDGMDESSDEDSLGNNDDDDDGFGEDMPRQDTGESWERGSGGESTGSGLSKRSKTQETDQQGDRKPVTKAEKAALQAKMKAKREYHRLNAAASRRRSKEMVEHLKAECARLTNLEKELTSKNAALKAQVSILKSHQGVPAETVAAPQGAATPSASQGANEGGPFHEGTMSRLVETLCA
eukprot:CAMPEP_0198149562 /NCGR_PEP_ID=MMETSP1443-20131203/47210_1 /TAXON_ID=186043 /ORGANISM="Entomoneis sp., Strain CCMP2396" /LENGTH=186 /DNA_ID=CAMNT_0043814643 /DNA_START=27 /DNA_END=584 /DNA_ORIENTATION=+